MHTLVSHLKIFVEHLTKSSEAELKSIMIWTHESNLYQSDLHVCHKTKYTCIVRKAKYKKNLQKRKRTFHDFYKLSLVGLTWN